MLKVEDGLHKSSSYVSFKMCLLFCSIICKLFKKFKEEKIYIYICSKGHVIFNLKHIKSLVILSKNFVEQISEFHVISENFLLPLVFSKYFTVLFSFFL